ncbi:DUF2726 domain-containing protein, partial [Massilia scottii]|uniref:DUF2726 domain-containing protein n=1 Tax=Massilia scottii TaxID=3057166 RepID=UPI0027966092
MDTVDLLMKILIAVIVIVIIASLLTIAAKGKASSVRTGAYRQRKIMTDNELEFFGRLVIALPEYYVFPQVAMTALLEAASTDKRKSHSDRLRIAQQRADYVVCAKNCDLVAVVELDDRTHSKTKDK